LSGIFIEISSGARQDEKSSIEIERRVRLLFRCETCVLRLQTDHLRTGLKSQRCDLLQVQD